jgi:hypothetical protein
MTDQISFPPLLDLSPGELAMRRQLLLSEIRREPERRRFSLPTTPPLRLRFAVPAAAAICAVFAAVVATATFTSGPAHKAPPTASLHGDQSPGPMRINYVHSGGALSSIAVTLTPNVANASVQLQVVHSDATSYAEAYAGSTQVVFQEQASTTASPASSFGLSTWSGTLSPSDWSGGGCQSGLYQIKWVAVQPGTSFANASAAPGNEVGASELFSCSGS